jgi:cytochrome P450
MAIQAEIPETNTPSAAGEKPFDYLRELNAALANEKDPVKRGQIEAVMVSKWLKEEPLPFLRQLRHKSPIFSTSFLTLVTRYQDVMEVLNANDIFTVDNISTKLVQDVGQTVLAMNDSPRYEHEKSLLHLAFPRSDLAHYRKLVTEQANQLLADVGVNASFDFAGDYALKVPAGAMARYLGVGELPTDKVVTWTHALFHDIFVNPTNEPNAVAAAQDARKECIPLIDGIIAARKQELLQAPVPAQPSLIDRYLQMQHVPETYLSDEGVRDVVLGLLMGCVDLSGGAIVNALVELMKRPHVLREAIDASNVEDDTPIAGYVLEALRFRPPSNGVAALCVRDHVIGRGTQYRTKIPAGSVVLACSASAMHDGEFIEAPEEFRPGRPLSTSYLFWEAGLHTCHGKYTAIQHIVTAIKCLLRAGKPQQVDPLPKGYGYPSAFRIRLVQDQV